MREGSPGPRHAFLNFSQAGRRRNENRKCPTKTKEHVNQSCRGTAAARRHAPLFKKRVTLWKKL